MKIWIRDSCVYFDDVGLRFDRRFISPAQVRSLANHWRTKLDGIHVGMKTYLPYSVNPEIVEAVEVSREGFDVVALRVVHIGADFTEDDDDPEEYLSRLRLRIIHRFTDDFVRCGFAQLKAAVERFARDVL